MTVLLLILFLLRYGPLRNIQTKPPVRFLSKPNKFNFDNFLNFILDNSTVVVCNIMTGNRMMEIGQGIPHTLLRNC